MVAVRVGVGVGVGAATFISLIRGRPAVRQEEARLAEAAKPVILVQCIRKPPLSSFVRLRFIEPISL